MPKDDDDDDGFCRVKVIAKGACARLNLQARCAAMVMMVMTKGDVSRIAFFDSSY
jgi:hypothetical protein